MLIGRHKTACLSCGFAAPHVKQNEGKLPYIHCPDCGLTVPTRNGKQAAGILANTRREGEQAGGPPQIPRRPDDIVIPAPAAAPVAASPPAPKPRGGFSTLLDALK